MNKPQSRWSSEAMTRRVKRRYAAERRFKALGLAAVLISLAFLAFLLVTMTVRGAGGFSHTFLTASDATDPAMVGVWGALKGSFLTIMVTMALAFPIGVLAAVYLEEFAKRTRWNDFIEVSINNLAAVPSIIFGLLGLAVFLNVMQLPRSAALVGGLTLALMTMPVIVIAGRNAIKAVPPSIRDAALGVGASKMQVVFHHVLPLALPGYPDRHHHRHGPRAGRNRAAADDRDARLYRDPAGQRGRSRDGASGADLPVVGRGRSRVRREDQRGDHRAAAVHAADERPRHLSSQPLRAPLVRPLIMNNEKEPILTNSAVPFPVDGDRRRGGATEEAPAEHNDVGPTRSGAGQGR